jgi:septal ring factor EnvC (AmiA/AmiB activator)
VSEDRTAERKNIRAAIDRLLAGTPLRSDGALTVVSLVAEADVKRHVLTHRHTDLKDEFYARVRAQGQVPNSERKLRQELKETKERLAEVLAENKQLKAETEAFVRIISVLEMENDQLKGKQGRTSTVIPIVGPR